MASIIGKIIAVRHAGTSTMGNPSCWVTIDTGAVYGQILRTQSNAGIAYGITNPEYRELPHEWHLSARGYVTHATPIVETCPAQDGGARCRLPRGHVGECYDNGEFWCGEDSELCEREHAHH